MFVEDFYFSPNTIIYDTVAYKLITKRFTCFSHSHVLSKMICFFFGCLCIHQYTTDIFYVILTQTDTSASDRTPTVVLDIESLAQPSDRSSGSPKMTVSSSLFVVNFETTPSHMRCTNLLVDLASFIMLFFNLHYFFNIPCREHSQENGLIEQRDFLILTRKTQMNPQRNF